VDVARIRFRSCVGARRENGTREKQNDEGKRAALARVHPPIFPGDAAAIPKSASGP
jgi:hypothetical protein